MRGLTVLRIETAHVGGKRLGSVRRRSYERIECCVRGQGSVRRAPQTLSLRDGGETFLSRANDVAVRAQSSASALRRGSRQHITNELRLRRAARGSGEHRRQHTGRSKQCGREWRESHRRSVRTRRRRNSRTLCDSSGAGKERIEIQAEFVDACESAVDPGVRVLACWHA